MLEKKQERNLQAINREIGKEKERESESAKQQQQKTTIRVIEKYK